MTSVLLRNLYRCWSLWSRACSRDLASSVRTSSWLSYLVLGAALAPGCLPPPQAPGPLLTPAEYQQELDRCLQLPTREQFDACVAAADAKAGL